MRLRAVSYHRELCKDRLRDLMLLTALVKDCRPQVLRQSIEMRALCMKTSYLIAPLRRAKHDLLSLSPPTRNLSGIDVFFIFTGAGGSAFGILIAPIDD